MSPLAESARKTVIVTGGAQRVGRAVVERFAEAAYDVGFTYRSKADDAKRLIDDLSHRPARVESARIDLADDDAVQQLASWTRAHFARVDVLVNCASMYVPDDSAAGASPALQRTLMNVNAIAPATLMANLTPELIASQGSVINFVDLLVERPMPSYSAYCASKAALQTTTLAYARKLAPHVRVNGIAPGVIAWPDDMPAADRAAYLKRVPLAREGTPREAAELVYFLAAGATYMTGQILRIDGGRSIA